MLLSRIISVGGTIFGLPLLGLGAPDLAVDDVGGLSIGAGGGRHRFGDSVARLVGCLSSKGSGFVLRFLISEVDGCTAFWVLF